MPKLSEYQKGAVQNALGNETKYVPHVITGFEVKSSKENVNVLFHIYQYKNCEYHSAIKITMVS